MGKADERKIRLDKWWFNNSLYSVSRVKFNLIQLAAANSSKTQRESLPWGIRLPNWESNSAWNLCELIVQNLSGKPTVANLLLLLDRQTDYSQFDEFLVLWFGLLDDVLLLQDLLQTDLAVTFAVEQRIHLRIGQIWIVPKHGGSKICDNFRTKCNKIWLGFFLSFFSWGANDEERQIRNLRAVRSGGTDFCS